MYSKRLLSALLTATPLIISAQNVGINATGAPPNANAILDVESTTSGVLLARHTTAQRTTLGGSLGATEEGLTVFDTDTDSYWVWDGTSWIEMVMGADNDWTVAGTDMYSNVTGSVGIGTAAPIGILTAYEGVSNSRYVFDIDGGAGSYTSLFNMDVTGLDIGHNSSVRDLNLITNNSDRLTIKPNGSVGIGTTAPVGLVTVYDNTSLSRYIFDFDPGAGSYSTTFRMDATGLDIGHNSTVRNLNLKTNSTDRLTIDPNGNVGIGTNTPAQTLHINDVMRLEPRATAPASPSAGDMYFDSTTNKLTVYDGTAWQQCW